MNWFRKSCPIEEFASKYLNEKIHTKCKDCEYWQNRKCKYEEVTAEKIQRDSRGLGVLAKESIMKAQKKGTIFSKETVEGIEQAAIHWSSLSHKEEEEYWKISKDYDEEWQKANTKGREEIEWRMHHWRGYMEDAFSPNEAKQKADNLDYNIWKYIEDEDDNT